MQAIMKEKNSDKRQKLLNEYMAYMQEGMMMNKNMGMGMKGGMDNRLHRMEQGMNMMHSDAANINAGMGWSMGLGGLIIGLITWSLVAGFSGWLIAVLYNKQLEE
jgi:hypothetical protein